MTVRAYASHQLPQKLLVVVERAPALEVVQAVSFAENGVPGIVLFLRFHAAHFHLNQYTQG